MPRNHAGPSDDEVLRLSVIWWLVANDGNGIYSDEDARAEGLEPLTLAGALELAHQIITRDEVSA